MNQHDPLLEKAILQWVNAVLPEQRVRKWSEFADGKLLWKLLVTIDAEWFTGDLPEDLAEPESNWIPKWQNLKHIDRAMSAYFSEKLEKPAHFGRSIDVDLKALAESGSHNAAVQILRLLIYQAVHSPSSVQRQAVLFESLDPTTSAALVNMVQTLDTQEQKQALIPKEQDSSSERDATSPQLPPSRGVSKERPSTIPRDRELDLEEQLAEQIRLKKDLIKTHEGEREEYLREIEHLREQVVDAQRSEARQVEEREMREKLDHLTQKELRALNVIANLEAETTELRSDNTSKQRLIERLQSEGTAKQELKDELQMVKADRDKLANASNANENLKKKIRTLQEIETQYKRLLEEVEENRSKIDDYDKVVAKFNALQRTTDENIQMIQTLELDSVTSSQRLKATDYEKKLIEQELRTTREQNQRQADEIDDLQTRLRDFEDGVSAPSSPTGKGHSLDDELAAGEKADNDTERTPKTESDVTLQAELLSAQQKIQMLQGVSDKVKEQYLDAMLENVGLRNSTEKSMSATEIEKSDPFIKQQSKLLAVEQELQRSKETHMELVAERAELQKQALQIPSNGNGNPLNAADTEKLAAIQKSHDQILEEYQALKQHSDLMTTEASNYKDLVFRSIRLQGEDDNPDRAEYLQTIKAQIDMVRQAASIPQGDELRDGFANTYCGKLIDALDRLQQMDKEKQITKTELERLKKDGKVKPADDNDKETAETSRKTANLQRELGLMQSAWYSIVGRLQSNTVVLARRTEAPKSMIRKQQAAVGGMQSARR